MSLKDASTNHPIERVITDRWSPYAFADRAVDESDLCALFEAARWAPSSNNEQPWRYIVATKDDSEQFQKVLSCLNEANQVWASHAPVLALGVVSMKFSRNGKENKAAVHDLGLASGNLCVEATARGLFVHQMIGILPERAREVFEIPENYENWTAMAIGYKGDPSDLPDKFHERDQTPRERKPLNEIVFSGNWGTPRQSC